METTSIQANPFFYLVLGLFAFLLAIVGLVLALTASDPGRRKLFWWATIGSAVGGLVLVVVYVVTIFTLVTSSFDDVRDKPRYEVPEWNEETPEEGEAQADSLSTTL